MKSLHILRSALVGGASAMTLASPASAKQFDIPRGNLANALSVYTQQAGVQIVYSDDEVRGRQTQGAHGNYTELAALTEILRGTGFTVQSLPASAIAIVPQQKEPKPRAETIQVAAAAPRAPAPGAVETVVVTAQHKSENIQNVPIAVTALSQEQLTARQIAGGPDLLRDVPNMDFTKTNFSGYNIELRGIGTQAISVTTDPAVAVAFNDTPFIRNHFFEQEFFDLQDVEVLLGPQGTLYGRNATAGVVNLKSALPDDSYQAMLSADIGNYSNRRLEAMLNIPIVGDKLDIRIAGEWTKRDGYTQDTTLGMPVDGRDLWSGRVTIGWKPIPDLQTYFIWEHFSEDDNRLRSGKQLCKTAPPVTNVDGISVPVPDKTEFVGGVFDVSTDYTSQSCQATSLYSPSAYGVPFGSSLPYVLALQVLGIENTGVDPYAETTQSTNLRNIESAILPSYRARNDTLEYNATYNINPALTFTSLTGYNQDFLWSSEDYNRFDTTPGIFFANGGTGVGALGPLFSPDPNVPGAFIFCDPQLGCSDRLVTQDLDEEHAWQLSQEFRLSSNFSGPFNFSVGGNYLHYETEESYYVFSNALSAYAVSDGFSWAGAGAQLAQGASLPNCLFTQINRLRTGGYQSPNPIAGGGVPVYSCVYIDPNPIGSLNNKGHNYFLSMNPYTLNSYALFGESYFNITPTLKLTAGLRWTVDQKHFIDIPSEVLNEGYGYSVIAVENQSWERPTGRVVLDWTPQLDFTDQTLLYASYSHGYKAGGANPPGASFPEGYGVGVAFADHPATFKPEYIEAFELGTKNTLLDNSLTLNGDIFYYNYTGYQISEIVDRTAINNNYNAHVEGAEVQANWEPIPGLKFNFAGGWEDTAAAGGDSGIDLMDRTAGNQSATCFTADGQQTCNSGWMVLKPFPTQASNCIMPDYVVAALITQHAITPDNQSSACALAYDDHLDPVTVLPYVANPTVSGCSGNPPCPNVFIPPNYPGFDPNNPAINNGEGFGKNLSGHKLPNAPPFTVSLGGEYSMPVSEDWAATLRADFYWQADSWARIFNDNPYDRIHGYANVNLALTLTSSNGWQVMGYVKNVFNVTAITGDFLNSDDSGLTTNVFLTDPRLFGVRVTKQLDQGDGFWGSDYSGYDFFTGLFSDADNGKPPLWVELGGQLEHIQGQGAAYVPGFLSTYSSSSILHEGTTPTEVQRPPLFSAGEEAKISFEPDNSGWVISASLRYGRSGNKRDVHHQTAGLHHQTYRSGLPYGDNTATQEKFVDTNVYHDESHSIMDFMAGKDVGLGMFGLDGSSVLSGGVRIAQYVSHSSVDMRARPDLAWKYIPSAAAPTRGVFFKNFHTYHAYENAVRKFRGVGPSISWSGSVPVAEADAGSLNLDWGVNAAVLFGRQRTKVRHQETGRYFSLFSSNNKYRTLYQNPAHGHDTNRFVTVPNLGGFAGFSYRYANAKISLGYRADFFFGAIDGGIDKRKSETLNMSGPFATISFGLGG